MDCKDLQQKLPELLFDSPVLPAEARAHIETCAPCGTEYASFRSTFALLDEWQAPEPSPYFDRKLAVRLREEASASPAGWFERLRSHLLFNTGAQFRPVLAGTMATVLLLGGGAFAGLSFHPGIQRGAQVSAAVDDLQILDKNDQALQEMDQLLQDDPSTDDDLTASPKS